MFFRYLAGLALVCCVPASAVTTFNFDFTGSSGSFSTYSAFSGALGVTAKAFYTSSATASIGAATVGAYSGAGLGICNPSSESSCSSPEHQIDNNGRYEFMLFKFSTPVDLASITIKNYGGASGTIDRDLTYYTSSSSASSITLGTLTTLGSGFSAATTVNCAGLCSGTTSVDTLVGTGVTYLLVGAAGPSAGDSGKDYFKISGLTVTTNPLPDVSSVPEPSTISTALIALAGLGWAARRRSLTR